jgi:hypothetical protein
MRRAEVLIGDGRSARERPRHARNRCESGERRVRVTTRVVDELDRHRRRIVGCQSQSRAASSPSSIRRCSTWRARRGTLPPQPRNRSRRCSTSSAGRGITRREPEGAKRLGPSRALDRRAAPGGRARTNRVARRRAHALALREAPTANRTPATAVAPRAGVIGRDSGSTDAAF